MCIRDRPSAEAALAHFAHKKAFAKWDPQVLADYIAHGTCDVGGKRVLSFDRQVETEIYNTLPDNLDRLLLRHPVKCPVAFIGGRQSVEMHQVGMAMTDKITKGRITPFIATLGGMAMFRSLALVFKDGGEYRSNVPQWANLFSPKIGEDSLRMFPVFIFLGLALILHVILKHTRYGTAVHAIGDNDKAALYSGIKIDRVKIITYSLCGLLCGIAAVLISSRMNSISSAQTGLMYELDAIAAVVVGGASMRGGSGRIWGTIIGVMILGVVNNMLNMISSSDTLKTLGLENINIAHLQGLVKGVIIIAAVLVQRQKE